MSTIKIINFFFYLKQQQQNLKTLNVKLKV